MNELVTQLVPTLTEHMLPALAEKIFPELIERLSQLISSTSDQPSTFINRPLTVSPTVPAAPTTANIDEVQGSSSDNGCNSPTSH